MTEQTDWQQKQAAFVSQKVWSVEKLESLPAHAWELQ